MRFSEFSCKVGKHSSTDYYAVVTSFMDIWIAVSVFPQVPISRAHSFLRKILPNSATHCSKIVQILRLATASHLWLKTERAVQKLQLLKAGIVLSYVSNIKSKSFFLFESASGRESTEMSNWWLMFEMSVILNLSVSSSTEQPKCSDISRPTVCQSEHIIFYHVHSVDWLAINKSNSRPLKCQLIRLWCSGDRTDSYFEKECSTLTEGDVNHR